MKTRKLIYFLVHANSKIYIYVDTEYSVCKKTYVFFGLNEDFKIIIFV